VLSRRKDAAQATAAARAEEAESQHELRGVDLPQLVLLRHVRLLRDGHGPPEGHQSQLHGTHSGSGHGGDD